MPRCKKKRCCRKLDSEIVFKPRQIPFDELEKVVLELDEFEVLRLIDHEGLNQIEAAEKMGISRGSVQRILKSARFKITEALVNKKAILIKHQ